MNVDSDQRNNMDSKTYSDDILYENKAYFIWVKTEKLVFNRLFSIIASL